MFIRYIALACIVGACCSCQKSVYELGVLVPPTVDQDPALPSQILQVAGVSRKVHVRVYGSPASPPLFLLHGSYSDSRSHRNLCEGLADRYFVVSWDQRGCGLSERITEAEFTFDAAVEEIDAMQRIYAPGGTFTVIGHSWGGGLAALYTSRRPEKVRQLVLMEPMPLTGADMQQLFKTIVEFSYFNESWSQLARQSQALGPRDHEQIDYRAMMILRSTMTAGYHCDGINPPAWPVWRVGGFLEYVRNKRLGNPVSGFKYDFTPGLERYANPVLILGGSCSSLGYEVQKKYTIPYFPNAQAVEIREAGHRINVEQYEAVMAELRRFLLEYR